MKLYELIAGDVFRFNADDHTEWRYVGSGWYRPHPPLSVDQDRCFHESRNVDVHPAAFVLRNAPTHKPPATFANKGGRQRMLIDGLDCLPGQQDLF